MHYITQFKKKKLKKKNEIKYTKYADEKIKN